MAKISILYHHFPHYRAPVLRALARSTRHEYSFFGSLDDIQGIKAFHGDDEVKIEPIKMQRLDSGRIVISAYEAAIDKSFDATIVLGNINMKGSWQALRRARKNGLATAYWAHGWIKKESWVREKIRNYYFSRADLTLVYGSRAKILAAKSGFPDDRVRVIWNSLDWEAQSKHYRKHVVSTRADLRASAGMPQGVPLLLTVSRVTDICYYDWLVDAAAKLRNTGNPVEIWMIGDGPALPGLVARAAEAGVPLHAHGALYDEARISQQIMAADIVVSPGKVGLTAMHALAYGTPVVTHGDLDRQMPEVEAVIEGKSGAFFNYGDINGLARSISSILESGVDMELRRQMCRDSLIGRFTPEDQARLIDDAMDEITNARK